ncbi:MAG: hypothetical protein AAB285_00220 [candidate division NC10 bacterium]
MLHGTGLLLLTAVAGYWALERAESHKGQLKKVGQLVGWVVIVTSFLGLACRVYAVATGQDCPSGLCPMTKKYSCPFSPKDSSPAPDAK